MAGCSLSRMFCFGCFSFFTGAHLALFGSSCNGFGFRNSDLDITLTFQGHKTDEVDNLCCFYLLHTNKLVYLLC